MKLRRLNISRACTILMVSRLVPILVAALCLQQPSRAQQQTASRQDVSVDPLKTVEWITGPQNVTLGDVANINVPSGYRLTDVHGARLILASFNDPIPDDLVGIFVPVAGKWLAILEYSPDGYVKKPDVMQTDTKAVLKQVLDQMNEKGKSSAGTLSWQSQPTYDVQRHLLQWAILVTTPASTKILSRTAALLARHGILQITVVQPFSLTGVPPIGQLAANITFKNGERYTDYQKGDKVAEMGLAELISGEKHAQSAGGSGTIAAWIYGGLVVCLIAGGVAVVVRRRDRTHRQHERRQRHRHRRAHTPVFAPAIKNSAPAGSVPSNQMSLGLKVNESNGHSQPKPVPHNSSGWKPFHHHRRKRVFDHSKFYMKVLRNFTYHSSGPGGMTNGKSLPNGHINSRDNGAFNGHVASNVPKPNDAMKSEIEDMIAIQKTMIQEQKRLLEEQTRMIEEKRWLIEEQAAFLKAQSALTAEAMSLKI